MTYHRPGVEAARNGAGARRKAVEAAAMDLAQDLRGNESFPVILLRFGRAMEAAGVTVAMLDRHAGKRGRA